jgi:hypothetical protein
MHWVWFFAGAALSYAINVLVVRKIVLPRMLPEFAEAAAWRTGKMVLHWIRDAQAKGLTAEAAITEVEVAFNDSCADVDKGQPGFKAKWELQ